MAKKAKKRVPASTLKRQDVLKLIDNLTSGEYQKGVGQLVVTPKGATASRWCCLGVWADQHGCTWKDQGSAGMSPVFKGKTLNKNNMSSLEPEIRFGLTDRMQGVLMSYNDRNETWEKVLHYLVDNLLPKAV